MDEIKAGTVGIKELVHEISLQIILHLEQGFSEDQAIYFGVEQAKTNWRKRNADKSGG